MNASGPFNRAWRVFATGLSFTVFGLACVLFGFTLFPLACLTAPDRDAARRRAQWIVSRWFKFFADFMSAVGILRYEIHGAEKLRRPGQLLVANHPTLIDVVLLIAHLPEVDCIIKRQIFDNPVMRWPALWAGYIAQSDAASRSQLDMRSGISPSVPRGFPAVTSAGDTNSFGMTPAAEQLIADCAATLRQGRSLLVFPEGTRSVPGQPIRMTHGAARIALEAGVPVLPVSIRCEPITLTKGLPWYRVPARRAQFTLTVGEPHSATEFLAQAGGSTSVATRRLTHHWERYFAERTGGVAAHPARTLDSGHAHAEPAAASRSQLEIPSGIPPSASAGDNSSSSRTPAVQPQFY